MAEDVAPDLEALAERLTAMEGYLHVDDARRQVAELEAESARAGFWVDPEAARETMTRLARARDDVQGIEGARATLDDARAAAELGAETGGEDLMAQALCHEIDHLDGVVYVDKMIEDVSDRYQQIGRNET